MSHPGGEIIWREGFFFLLLIQIFHKSFFFQTVFVRSFARCFFFPHGYPSFIDAMRRFIVVLSSTWENVCRRKRNASKYKTSVFFLVSPCLNRVYFDGSDAVGYQLTDRSGDGYSCCLFQIDLQTNGNSNWTYNPLWTMWNSDWFRRLVIASGMWRENFNRMDFYSLLETMHN